MEPSEQDDRRRRVAVTAALMTFFVLGLVLRGFWGDNALAPVVAAVVGGTVGVIVRKSWKRPDRP